MKRFVFLGLCLSIASCGGSGMEDLKQANEKLNNENRSLKSSLNKAQNQIERAGEIGGRMLFLVNQIRGVKARIATNMGDIELKFHPEKAPVHCLAFITRAESGFYDNTKFHRVIKNFMIQGGDPNSKDDDPSDDGMGGPLVHIPHEFNDTKTCTGHSFYGARFRCVGWCRVPIFYYAWYIAQFGQSIYCFWRSDTGNGCG